MIQLRTENLSLAYDGAEVVRVQNRQIAATRNSGARIAKGDCFIFVRKNSAGRIDENSTALEKQ